jgi:hypothetical protein
MQRRQIFPALVIPVLTFLIPLALLLTTFTSEARAQSDECADGFVWREAFPDDHVCVSPQVRDMVKRQNHDAGQFTTQEGQECAPGYVFRMAGPRDQVCVTEDERDQAEQDNRMAETRLKSTQVPDYPDLADEAGSRRNMLAVPQKEGCFGFADGAWHEIACVPEETARRNFPPPAAQFSILSNRKAFYRLFGLPSTLPIRLASTEVSHLSDPTISTLTDSLAGKDAFSIQVNTNFFPASNGNTGWVQFVLQSKPDDPSIPNDDDQLCVWQVDVTLAISTKNASGYTQTCVSVPKLRTVWGPNDVWPGGGKRITFVGPGVDINEKAKVAGFVSTAGNAGTRLYAWAFVPWAPFSAYAVGVADSQGLNGRWTEISGDIIGLGNGSQANFTRTTVRTVLQASSCIAGGASFACPSQPVPPQFALGTYATPEVTSVTGESNNLASIYGFVDHKPVFSCAGETCTLDYSTGARSFTTFDKLVLKAYGP